MVIGRSSYERMNDRCDRDGGQPIGPYPSKCDPIPSSSGSRDAEGSREPLCNGHDFEDPPMSNDCGCVGGSSSVESVSATRESAVQQKIGISLQAASLQITKDVGAAMISLIDAASQIGKEIGKGQSFDHSA